MHSVPGRLGGFHPCTEGLLWAWCWGHSGEKARSRLWIVHPSGSWTVSKQCHFR